MGKTELPATRVCLDRQSALWAQFVSWTAIQTSLPQRLGVNQSEKRANCIKSI